MAKALTQLAIDNLKPGPARREVPDGGAQGLFLIVQPSGAKTWAVRYRVNGLPRISSRFMRAREHATGARQNVS
jgi:Arm DNA-binding domain